MTDHGAEAPRLKKDQEDVSRMDSMRVTRRIATRNDRRDSSIAGAGDQRRDPLRLMGSFGGCRSCVGNIYWERYGFEPWHAAALLHWLRREKAFTLDGGYEELANWWDSGIADDAHVRKLLVDAAKDDRL